MRVVVAVAHYFDGEGGGGYGSLGGDRAARVEAVRSCLSALVANFGGRQFACEYSDRPIPVPANTHPDRSPDFAPITPITTPESDPATDHVDLNRADITRSRGLSAEIDFAKREEKSSETSSFASHEIEIVVCTTAGKHLLNEVGIDFTAGDGDGARRNSPLRLSERTCDAKFLGFECHQALKEAGDGFDVYAYLEDDLILHDAMFFEKILYFQKQFGPVAVLQPNRFEVLREREPTKVYIDIRTPTKVGQQEGYEHNFKEPLVLELEHLDRTVKLERAENPHSGCFFLSNEQMRHWKSQPYFGMRSDRFFGPLESAATIHLMKTFRIYKPALANANFLELEHYGDAWARKLPAFQLGAG